MDFTFVVNGEHDSRKRRTVQGACEPCKKRKKRCTHHLIQIQAVAKQHSQTPTSDTPSETQQQHPRPSCESEPGVGRQDLRGKVHTAGRHKLRYGSTPPPTTRFVGDLNPEASIIADSQPDSATSRDRHNLGIWLEHENGRDQSAEPSENVLQENNNNDRAHLLPARIAKTSPHFKHLLPNHSNQLALANIYFSRFHPVLPILDEDHFMKELRNRTISLDLVQAMCLIISKDVRARPHLVLEGLSSSTNSRSNILTPSQFSSHLYSELREAVAQRREQNRYHLIRTLALLSLHIDGDIHGAEDASMHLVQAVHYAQTMGLHLGRSKGHRQLYDKLFWCLWCLSLFNAASNGRPRLMSDQDIGLNLEDVLECCHPAFRIFLSLSQLLARVTRLYQPTSDPEVCGVDRGFPSFESIVDENHGWAVEASMLTSMELYYHGIAILSYRTRSTDDDKLIEPSSSSLRQELSAQKVMRILQHTPLPVLVPLPTTPYAISLALSQTYRQFRRSRSATKRAIAQEQLECYLMALKGLSDQFQSAMTMAAIGRKVLRQIHRLNDTVARQAAGASHNYGLDTADFRRTSIHTGHSTVIEDPGASNLAADGSESNPQPYESMYALAELDGLFSANGTLQAMDTVFDNFMGLDLPNDWFSASLTDDALEAEFGDSR